MDEIEDYFYNETGEFKPLHDNEGNVNEKISHLRNVFLESEKEYFMYLLSTNFEYFNKLVDLPSDALYAEAQKRIDMIEYGEVPEEDLDYQEGIITFCLAAVRDKALIRKLVKSHNMDEEESRTIRR